MESEPKKIAKEEILSVDKLTSGNRDHILIAGMLVAQGFKDNIAVVLMADILGRVVYMPLEAITINKIPLLSDADLNQFDLQTAVGFMEAEGRSDQEVNKYLSNNRRGQVE